MATIKAYTDLEQSCKLAEILPLESADMFYADLLVDNKHKYIVHLLESYGFKTFKDTNKQISQRLNFIPCWSLAALQGTLPKGTNISTPKPINALGYCCWNQYDEIYEDNPVDACYEMILKLHELKML